MRLRRLAWGSWAVFVAFSLGTVAVIVAGQADVGKAFTVLALGFATVGALVSSRVPENPVGWLLLAIAVSFAVQGFADAYVAEPGKPAAVAVAWVATWAWYLWLYGAAMFLPLLFPAGRLLSRRWRLAVWVASAALAASILSAAFGSDALDVESPAMISNPVAVGGALGEVVDILGTVSDYLAVLGFVLAVVSVVLRLRRSSGVQRQQVKWFAYVGGLAVVALLLAMIEVIAQELGVAGSWVTVVGAVGWLSALFLIMIGLPIAVGLAILRHGLYDIDVVIKRTLVYGALTATLVTAYLGSVLLLRVALTPVAGKSELAVAGSTLAVAALFRPARARIQSVVDRRFYRSRYDATQTVQSFAGRLRHEVELDAVTYDLRTVVASTMQPVHVSLWLRGGGA